MSHAVISKIKSFPNLARVLTQNAENFALMVGIRACSSSEITMTKVPKKLFTEEEQNRILHTFNFGELEDLTKYGMAVAAARKIIYHRNKKGMFKTVEEILFMPSLDVPVLNKFCQSIASNKQKKESGSTKRRSDVLNPPLSPEICKNIQICSGIWVCRNLISWAQLDMNGNLINWDCASLDSALLKDILPLTESVAEIVSKIPKSDIYVLEASPSLPFSRINKVSYHIHLQDQQIKSSIVSILGTRSHFEIETPDQKNEENESFLRNVYTIRSNLPARLFNLIVGSEVVSAQGVVDNLLMCTTDNKNGHSIAVTPEMKKDYSSRPALTREQMNWSLLVTYTFLRLLRMEVSYKQRTQVDIAS